MGLPSRVTIILLDILPITRDSLKNQTIEF
jgi:hypothetical protein